MNLRDMLNSSKQHKDIDAVTDMVVDKFEKNTNLYSGKSVAWCLRITADELSMKLDEVREILEKYYSDDVQQK